MARKDESSRSRSPRVTDSARTVKAIVGQRPIVCDVSFCTKEGLEVSQAFKASSGDIFISTYPKTGTTWMQQICHQLRTGGDDDFDEITEERIVPWLEVGPSLGQDIELSQKATPRCFKTHQPLSQLSHLESDGARYLCVVRDPEAALLSLFKFELGHDLPATRSRDINVFLRSGFFFACEGSNFSPQFGASIWDFYAELWRCRNLSNVMMLAFEHTKKDLDAMLNKIAVFMGLSVPDGALRQRILERCSMQWMSTNDHLFDDHFIPKRLAQLNTGKHFTQVGKVGHDIKKADDANVTLSEESRELLKRKWKELVEPISGHATYADMIAELGK